MQISVEKSSALERRLTVEVPEERIETEVQSRLENLRKNVRIDGFRQGKAPLKVVRRQFGARVRDEIVNEILQSSFTEAMSTEALKPAGRPVIDPIASTPGAGLTYTATFEVFPDIELAPLDGIRVVKRVCTITESDIDTMIAKLREQNKEWLAVERPSATGDQLNINFNGSIEGESFDGGNGENFDIVIGTGMMIEGFEEGLLGRVAGDAVELNLEFPADYRNTVLAGKPVRFEIVVNKVAEPVLPEVDARFMEKFGVKDGGLAAFRAEIRANMEKERERALRQQFSAEVMEKVTAANSFDVPASLVAAETQRLRQQFARELIMRGVNPGDAALDFDRSVRERAANRVKLGLVMAEIIKQAELRVDPGKVREMIENMASSYEDPAAVVKWHYDNPEQMQQMEALCLEEEAVNWIAGRVQVTETTISFDALMNPVQTENTVEAGS